MAIAKVGRTVTAHLLDCFIVGGATLALLPSTFAALAATAGRDCQEPCDGPALTALFVWVALVTLLWVSYILLSVIHRRTPGMKLLLLPVYEKKAANSS